VPRRSDRGTTTPRLLAVVLLRRAAAATAASVVVADTNRNSHSAARAAVWLPRIPLGCWATHVQPALACVPMLARQLRLSLSLVWRLLCEPGAVTGRASWTVMATGAWQVETEASCNAALTHNMPLTLFACLVRLPL
jgi:hypothetical protein